MTFSFSGTINRFFNLLATNGALFLLLGLLGSVLPALVINYGLETVMHVTSQSWIRNWSNFTTNESFAALAGYVVIGAFNLFNLAMITEVAILRSVGKPVEIWKVISHALANIIPIFIISILVGIVMVGAFMLLVVPGFMFMMASYVAVPARIAEPGSGLWGSVKRSFDLTRNHRWQIFGLIVVMSLIFGAVNEGIGWGSIPLQKTFALPPIVNTLTPIAINSFETLLENIFTAAIYVCLRESRDKMTPDTTAALFD